MNSEQLSRRQWCSRWSALRQGEGMATGNCYEGALSAVRVQSAQCNYLGVWLY